MTEAVLHLALGGQGGYQDLEGNESTGVGDGYGYGQAGAQGNNWGSGRWFDDESGHGSGKGNGLSDPSVISYGFPDGNGGGKFSRT